MSESPIDYSKLEAAYQIIVDHLKANTDSESGKENFHGTALRCAKALVETCKPDADISKTIAEIIGRVFPVESNSKALGMVVQGPITINSHCPHHLFPVRYEAYVTYIPADGRVLGLSKLARIAKALGNRPVLHEQLASDIADVLHHDKEHPSKFPQLESKGSAAMLVGVHSCMSCRGIEEDAKTLVTELRGVLWESGFESKFYQAVAAMKNSNPF